MINKSIFRPTVFNCHEYQAGKTIEEVKKELGLKHIAKLSSNENPYGPSPKVFEAIQSELPNLSMYPERSFIDLLEAIAEANGVEVDNIVVGHGSETIIQIIPQLFINQGEEVILAEATYGRHAEASMLMGAKLVEVPMKNFRFDLEAMADAITDKTKLIWICNPNNPTGSIVKGYELSKFLARVPDDVIVVFDEAYQEYVDDPDYISGLEFLKKGYQNVVVLKTFSKAYGMAGIRLGYGIVDSEIKHLLDTVKEPFNLGRIPIVTGPAAIRDKEWLKKCVEDTLKEKQYFYDEFFALGFEIVPSCANFVLVDVKQDAQDLFERLMRKGVLVRPATGWGYSTHIRVTMGTHQDNEKFIKELKQSI